MRIALVSLNQVWENKVENMKFVASYCEIAATNNVEIIIFPEMTCTGFSMNTMKLAEPRNESWTIKEYQKIAIKNKIKIIAGVILEGNKLAQNVCVGINENGIVDGIYIKNHPFSLAQENIYFEAGESIAVLPWSVNFGLSICYDLRFPELFRAMSEQCKILVNIANWPNLRVDQWHLLLKARAIENQAFMIGVNRTGKDGNDFIYDESSMVIGPDGKSLDIFNQIDDLKIIDLDLNIVDAHRIKFPFLKDKKSSSSN